MFTRERSNSSRTQSGHPQQVKIPYVVYQQLLWNLNTSFKKSHLCLLSQAQGNTKQQSICVIMFHLSWNYQIKLCSQALLQMSTITDLHHGSDAVLTVLATPGSSTVSFFYPKTLPILQMTTSFETEILIKFSLLQQYKCYFKVP